MAGASWTRCPRCSGSVYNDGMIRCSACSSVWLDTAAVTAEWEVKNKANGYVEAEFLDDLSDLVAITQISTMHEMAAHLELTANMRQETLDKMNKDAAEYSRYLGELEALTIVRNWMLKQAEKIQRDMSRAEATGGE